MLPYMIIVLLMVCVLGNVAPIIKYVLDKRREYLNKVKENESQILVRINHEENDQFIGENKRRLHEFVSGVTTKRFLSYLNEDIDRQEEGPSDQSITVDQKHLRGFQPRMINGLTPA
jgi:flagellar biosynthesis chaperone FliJ